MEEQVMSQVKQTLAPEFINRLDEIIIFDELTDDDLMKIVDLQLKKLNELLSSRSLMITISEDARRWLIDKTVADRSYGARPLKRALQKYIEDELSEALIQGDVIEDSSVEIFLKDDRIAFRTLSDDYEKLSHSV
jgi:ATP-dependent Clp protease ATP-binding subunit ClpC